jgi:mRNA-degrading endonuclease toxin of MazEF toxin-antitoxin module
VLVEAGDYFCESEFRSRIQDHRLTGTDMCVPRDCAVKCDHLQTVSKGKIGARLTSLSPARMAAVSRAIRFALDI